MEPANALFYATIFLVLLMIVYTLRHFILDVLRPMPAKTGMIKVRPRRLGFDMIYDPETGINWEARGKMLKADGSVVLHKVYGRMSEDETFTEHDIDIRGGSILNIIAPEGPRMFIKLNGNIMDGPLGETAYNHKWVEIVRALELWKERAMFWEQKFNNLSSNYSDELAEEVERATTKAIPAAIKATVEGLTKHG